MIANAWPQYTAVQKNVSAAAVALKDDQHHYVNSVTWPRTETVQMHHSALEVATDVVGPVDVSAVKTWAERAIDLARIRTLQTNWDGDDSAPPTFGVWSRADIFFSVLRDREPANPPKKIAVSPDGLIALEWFEGDSFVRAEIGDSERVEWMYAIPGFPTGFKTEIVAELTTLPPEQGQVWHREPAVVDEPAYASER